MAVFNIGDVEVRSNTVDQMVKQVAAFSFRFRQSMALEQGGGWTEDFFRETQAILTAQTGRSIALTPRGAKPAEIKPEWDKKSTELGKHIADLNIPWEDRLRQSFNMFERAVAKSAEAVANSEDSYIWTVVKADTDLQTLSVTNPWDGANANPFKDLMAAADKIGSRPYNYPTSSLDVHLPKKEISRFMEFVTDKGSSWQAASENIVQNQNGRMGRFGSFNFIENEAVDVSYGLVCVPNRWATLREAEGLTTVTTIDEMVSIRIRSGLVSVPKITDPKAAVRMTGLRA